MKVTILNGNPDARNATFDDNQALRKRPWLMCG
jgi:hypothetical protein